MMSETCVYQNDEQNVGRFTSKETIMRVYLVNYKFKIWRRISYKRKLTKIRYREKKIGALLTS